MHFDGTQDLTTQIVPVVEKFLTSCAVWRGRDRRGLIPSIPVPPPSYTRNHVPPQTSPEDEKMRRAALVGSQSHLATFPLSSHFEASFRDQISGEKMGLERGKAQRNQELLKLTIRARAFLDHTCKQCTTPAHNSKSEEKIFLSEVSL